MNRRIQVVRLTEADEAAFLRLHEVALAFDAKLRAGLTDADLDCLDGLLGQVTANTGGADEGSPPWAGLAEQARGSAGSAPP